MHKSLIVLKILLLITFVSCTSRPEEKSVEEKKDNILTNYVKTPLDQAKGVSSSLNQRTKTIDQENQGE